MAWFRLDDQGAFHEKVLAAGNEAYGAWVRAGQWSSGRRTEGRVPRATALTIAPLRVWNRLIEAKATLSFGLVEPVGDDFQIHDYLDWNPTADEVETKRSARAEAGRKGGLRSGQNRRREGTGASRDQMNRAANEANLAIKRGDLTRRPCEACGAEPAEAHHDDYSKPLDVRWLCKAHHTEHHTSIRQSNRGAIATATATATAEQKDTPSPSPSPSPVPREKDQEIDHRPIRAEDGPLVTIGTARCEEVCHVFLESLADGGQRRGPVRDKWDRQALCDAVSTHLDIDGTIRSALTELRNSVADWVAAKRDEARFTSGWSPRKFGEWLVTRDEVSASLPPVIESSARHRSRLPPLPPEPEAEPLTPEERAEIERHLAGGGRSSLLLEVLEDDRNHVIPRVPKIAGVDPDAAKEAS